MDRRIRSGLVFILAGLALGLIGFWLLLASAVEQRFCAAPRRALIYMPPGGPMCLITENDPGYDEAAFFDDPLVLGETWHYLSRRDSIFFRRRGIVMSQEWTDCPSDSERSEVVHLLVAKLVEEHGPTPIGIEESEIRVALLRGRPVFRRDGFDAEKAMTALGGLVCVPLGVMCFRRGLRRRPWRSGAERCWACGYSREGLPGSVAGCPECGVEFDAVAAGRAR
ncbi:MAG: hypothetical protein SFZ24_11025 [Planctomycetota bacterium]|nr:hypothetical protein [Planctomycetota bacterium]